MLTKYLLPFESDSEPAIDIIDLGADSLPGLTKRARDERIDRFVRDVILPHRDPSKVYLHINAMGAGEYYGANRNGDFFPEDNLLKYYKTFESAHVFRHHINKDPAKAIGRVLLAIYNEKMHRVELIVEVDKSLGRDVESRVIAGDNPWTSMACKTPYDTCSVCGNRAHSRAEYCDHLANGMNKVAADGKRSYAINDGPLRFFDISIVVKPADPTSGVLEKVAAVLNGSSAFPTAEAQLGGRIGERDYSLKQLTAMNLHRMLNSSEPVPVTVEDPDDSVLPMLRALSASQLANTFAETGIYPSMEYVMRILDDRVTPEIASIAGSVLPFVEPNLVGRMEIKVEDAPKEAKIVLARAAPRSSFMPEQLEKAAYYPIDPPMVLGYNSVNLAPTPVVKQVLPEEPRRGLPLLSWIVALAATSLLLKAYSHSLAERKSDIEKSSAEYSLNGLKEGLGKTVFHSTPAIALASGLGLAYAGHKMTEQANQAGMKLPELVQKHPYLSTLLGGAVGGRLVQLGLHHGLKKYAGVERAIIQELKIN
jgi:hypothetical protein